MASHTSYIFNPNNHQIPFSEGSFRKVINKKPVNNTFSIFKGSCQNPLMSTISSQTKLCLSTYYIIQCRNMKKTTETAIKLGAEAAAGGRAGIAGAGTATGAHIGAGTGGVATSNPSGKPVNHPSPDPKPIQKPITPSVGLDSPSLLDQVKSNNPDKFAQEKPAVESDKLMSVPNNVTVSVKSEDNVPSTGVKITPVSAPVEEVKNTPFKPTFSGIGMPQQRIGAGAGVQHVMTKPIEKEELDDTGCPLPPKNKTLSIDNTHSTTVQESHNYTDSDASAPLNITPEPNHDTEEGMFPFPIKGEGSSQIDFEYIPEVDKSGKETGKVIRRAKLRNNMTDITVPQIKDPITGEKRVRTEEERQLYLNNQEKHKIKRQRILEKASTIIDPATGKERPITFEEQLAAKLKSRLEAYNSSSDKDYYLDQKAAEIFNTYVEKELEKHKSLVKNIEMYEEKFKDISKLENTPEYKEFFLELNHFYNAHMKINKLIFSPDLTKALENHISYYNKEIENAKNLGEKQKNELCRKIQKDSMLFQQEYAKIAHLPWGPEKNDFFKRVTLAYKEYLNALKTIIEPKLSRSQEEFTKNFPLNQLLNVNERHHIIAKNVLENEPVKVALLEQHFQERIAYFNEIRYLIHEYAELLNEPVFMEILRQLGITTNNAAQYYSESDDKKTITIPEAQGPSITHNTYSYINDNREKYVIEVGRLMPSQIEEYQDNIKNGRFVFVAFNQETKNISLPNKDKMMQSGEEVHMNLVTYCTDPFTKEKIYISPACFTSVNDGNTILVTPKQYINDNPEEQDKAQYLRVYSQFILLEKTLLRENHPIDKKFTDFAHQTDYQGYNIFNTITQALNENENTLITSGVREMHIFSFDMLKNLAEDIANKKLSEEEAELAKFQANISIMTEEKRKNFLEERHRQNNNRIKQSEITVNKNSIDDLKEIDKLINKLEQEKEKYNKEKREEEKKKKMEAAKERKNRK